MLRGCVRACAAGQAAVSAMSLGLGLAALPAAASAARTAHRAIHTHTPAGAQTQAGGGNSTSSGPSSTASAASPGSPSSPASSASAAGPRILRSRPRPPTWRSRTGLTFEQAKAQSVERWQRAQEVMPPKKGEKLNLANQPPVPPPTSAEIPKQKVQMYSKILRVLRSPVKGAVPNTDGDDYVLDSAESQPTAMFTGLISANLSGPAPKRGGRKSGRETGRSFGKGGRKAATAKVWIQKAVQKGTGDFYVNGLRYVEYFTELDHRWELCAPFFYTNTLTDFDMIAVVRGGGRSGQAGAIKHAAAKALQAYDRARYRPMLKKKFLLSRDARVVERKKYGQRKARKRFTFVKR